MSTKNNVTKYGAAALVLAAVIIGASMYIPSFVSKTGGATYVVALTDPPQLPPGTTSLNLTYSGVSIHVANGGWTNISSSSGTVDLYQLYKQNESQVLGSIGIPNGSVVDQVKLYVSSVSIDVNGVVSTVTPLSKVIVITIANPTAVDGHTSGTLLNIASSIVSIAGTNSNGNATNYYVLVPSVSAIQRYNMANNETHAGQHVKLSAKDHQELQDAEDQAKNVSISSASVSVSGNVTTISVTLTNDGNSSVTIPGLVIQGDINATMSIPANCSVSGGHDQEDHSNSTTGATCSTVDHEMEHPDSLIFSTNGTALVPLFGDFGDHALLNSSSMLTVQPHASVTLSFQGVIQLTHVSEEQSHNNGQMPTMVLTPVSGSHYTIRLMGEGFEPFTVTAT